MKLRKNQTGFAVVELLLALIFLALVVFIGYYVYHNQKSTKTANTSQNSNTTASSNTAATTKYLDITQWGVKLPISDNLVGATYTVGSSNGLQTVSIAVPNSSCDSMATIFRGQASDINPTTMAMDGSGGQTFQATGKKLGNYYYAEETGNATACFSGEQMMSGSSMGVETNAVYTQLRTAFDHMSAASSN